MPNLNKGRYVKDAIKSVLAQTYQNFELIVVENGSIDESISIIQECSKQDSRIILLREPLRGASSARNTGIANAHGDLIAFLDSDDVYHREKLSKQVRIFEEEPSTYVCCTEGWIIDACGKPTGRLYNRDLVPVPKGGFEGSILRELLRECLVLGGSVMIRKHCTAHEMFDPKLTLCEDWDFYVRLAKRYRFRYISEPLYGYRIYEGNKWNPSNEIHNLREICKVYRKWLTCFEGLDGVDRQFLMKQMLKGYRRLGSRREIVRLALSNSTASELILRALGRRLRRLLQK